MNNKLSIFGIRATAIVEVIVGLLILVLIDQIAGNGDMFWDVNPHPFWIVVILVAAQYGANEALMAAAAASIVALLGPWPDRAEGADVFGHYYDILINPILWFTFGLIAGVFTERHLRKTDRLAEDLDASREREETITESYSFVKGRKEELETQIAGKLTSSVQAYRSAKSIETLDPKEVLKGIEDLVSAVMSPQKFSLFMQSGNKLEATILHGWSQSDGFSHSIDSHSSLYQSVIGNRNTLNIANSDHEIALERQGVLAGPIVDQETGKVVGMLKIEQLDFVNLSLNTVETFKALCEWIGTAIVNAENYQTVKDSAVINPEYNLMTYSFFKRQSDYLANLAKRVGFDLSMVVVRVTDAEKIDSNDRVTIARQLSESVRSVLRNIDLAFEYQTDGDEYSILLPATSQAGAKIVRDKIAKDLDRNLRNFGDTNFSYIVQAIHEAA